MTRAHYICYAAADRTGGRAQAVMQVTGSSCKHRRRFAHLLTSCCTARFRTDHRPVPVHGLGVVDSGHRQSTWITQRIWFKRDTGLKPHILSASSHYLCSCGRNGHFTACVTMGKLLILPECQFPFVKHILPSAGSMRTKY